ncbi:hypothetical protein BASA50_004252 [Batrachochytrium salamandrivorans]|uniref:Vacuolar membrane-associated protein IML1 n=1 Tax=Batrachochytrium salamandrivorans TaxID=1357716 RepID=A0ABQ8FG62_9FUNG|nr:hypothetical protein BASA60_001933 [Batrachochytrium salamandrivorans]KAH6597646.1 hypothetical protein BASA50_004252 [Batrachochytrium salamandrivorans]
MRRTTASVDGQVLNLWVHDERYSRLDVVVNPDWFPGVHLGDLVEIHSAELLASNAAASTSTSAASNDPSSEQTPTNRVSFATAQRNSSWPLHPAESRDITLKDRLILQVSVIDEELIAKQPQLQISVAQHIATLFELKARTDVVVRKVDKESVTASFVEIAFRDQYIGRSDMWRLKMSLTGTALHCGKQVLTLGIRGQVKDIIINGTSAKCCYVSDTTKAIFRSETAKYFIFIQMSKEMWEFDEDGELFFEKCVHGFLPELFSQWKAMGANHVVSIVLFARIHGVDATRFDLSSGEKSTPIYYSTNSQPCRDHYRVVVDRETHVDWAQVLVPLKREFVRFQRDVLEQTDASGTTVFAGTNSPASEGNILEAINLALNPFDKHYVDRDLMRTGLSIVVVTPGTGYFEVDKKLCRLTWQRMVDNGVGLDMVCLAKPPLYTVPLFQFVSHEATSGMPKTTQLPNQSTQTSQLSPSLLGGIRENTYGGINDPDSDQRSVYTNTSSSRQDRLAPDITFSGRSSGSEKKQEAWDPLYNDEDPHLGGQLTSFYTIPNWIDCSFWNRSTPVYTGMQKTRDAAFVSRCRMYEVQMMGFLEQVGTKIGVPYLETPLDSHLVQPDISKCTIGEESVASTSLQQEDYSRYDASLFEVHCDVDSVSVSSSYRAGSQIQHQQQQQQQQQQQHQQLRPMYPDLSRETAFSPLGEIRSRHPTKNRMSPEPHTDPIFATSYRVAIESSSEINEIRRHPNASGEGVDVSSVMHDSRNAPFPRSLPQRMSLTRNTRTMIPLISATTLAAPHGYPPRFEPVDRALQISGSFKEHDYGRHFDAHMLERIGRDNGVDNGSNRPEGSQLLSTGLQPIKIRSKGVTGQLGHNVANDTMDKPGVYSVGHRSSFSDSGSYQGVSSPAYDSGRHFSKVSPGRSIRHLSNRQTLRQNYVNPCNPIKNVIRASSQARRWEHIFPKLVMASRESAWTNWKPLCRPACLPLTTEFFPSPDELLELYQEYTYTVSPAEDANPYQSTAEQHTKKVESLLIELISQRLAQGFQLIVSTIQEGSQKLPGTPAPASQGNISNGLSSGQVPGNMRYNSTSLLNNPLKPSFQHVYQPTFTFSTTTPYYVSLGDHVHRLFYDASGHNVEIKRYIRKLSYDTESIIYPCAIWSKNLSGYESKTVCFSYPSLATYNWNYLDHLIAGYQEEMTDALRYWRARFLLIPTESLVTLNTLMNTSNDTLDEEEVRIAAFNKFIDALERLRWVPPTEANSSANSAKNTIRVQFTTFDPATFVKSELANVGEAPPVSVAVSQRRQSVVAPLSFMSMSTASLSTPDKLSKSCSPLEIAVSLQQPGGPVFKDRRWHFTHFERVCVGSECVDWLIQAFSDINNREEAVQFGNYLLEKNVLQHAYRKHRFMDGFYFYSVGKDFDVDLLQERSSGNSGWFGNKGASSVGKTYGSDSAGGGLLSVDSLFPPLSLSQQLLSPSALSPSPLSPLPQGNSSTFPATPEPFNMTRQIVLDMDPLCKSTRQERAILHYDTTHNPKNCYHIQLHWLVCTPRLIEDMLRNWGRIAEKCYLKLVEAPVEQAQIFSDDNPFQSVIVVSLAKLPPSASDVQNRLGPDIDIPPLWFEAELVRSHNFVLDVEADSQFPKDSVTHSFSRSPYCRAQYIHRSGVALVQIGEDGKFLWVDNRVYLAGNSSNSGAAFGSVAAAARNAPSPNVLLDEFQRICLDVDLLSAFWADAEKRISVKSGSEVHVSIRRN